MCSQGEVGNEYACIDEAVFSQSLQPDIIKLHHITESRLEDMVFSSDTDRPDSVCLCQWICTAHDAWIIYCRNAGAHANCSNVLKILHENDVLDI